MSVLFFIAALSGSIYAVSAYSSLHLNIQVTYTNGSIETGTFAFVFNISSSSDCNVSNIVYSNSTTLTTDSRGIISYYLDNVVLSDYSQQYWLCYYRDGVLIDTSKLAQVPYAFYAGHVPSGGVLSNGNINISAYNFTAAYLFGNGQYLTGISGSSVTAGGNNGAIQFNSNGALGGNESQFFINSTSGFVGIGTSSPSRPFEIDNSGSVLMLLNSSNTANNYSLMDIYNYNNNSYLRLGIFNGGIAGLAASATTVPSLAILPNGAVGIGTTTPTHTLDVFGDIYAESSSGGGLGWIALRFPSNNSELRLRNNTGSDNVVIGSQENSYFNGGNVGIGTTSPKNTLNVVGDLNVTGIIYGNLGAGSSNGVWNQSGSYVYPANLGWNVGIGTSSPSAPLHVVNNSGYVQGIFQSLTGSGGIQLWSSAGQVWDLQSVTPSGPVGGDFIIYDRNSSAYRMVIQNGTGYVGIGTTSPNYQLDVNGNSISQGLYSGNGSAGTVIYTSSPTLSQIVGINRQGNTYNNLAIRSAASPNGIYLATTGNVGIGTTSPAYNLDVNGTTGGIAASFGEADPSVIAIGSIGTGKPNGFVGSYATGGGGKPSVYLGSNVYYNGTAWVTPSSANTAALIVQNGTYNFFSGGSGIGTTKVYIDNSGNVGIGTTSPVGTLDINSSGAATNVFIRSPNSTTRSQLVFANSTGAQWAMGLGSTNSEFFIGQGSSFYTAQKLTILPSGNVGINTTSPQNTLNVVGDLNVTGTSYLGNVVLSATNITVDYLKNYSTAGINVPNNLYVMGNMGVGTTTPQTPLDVYTTANTLPNGFLRLNGGPNDVNRTIGQKADILITTQDTATYGGLGEIDFSTFSPAAGYGTNLSFMMASITAKYTSFQPSPLGTGGDLIFSTRQASDTSMQDRLHITAAGNVGIGTASPVSKLDVEGSLFSQNGLTDNLVLDPQFANTSNYWSITGGGTVAQTLETLDNGDIANGLNISAVNVNTIAVNNKIPVNPYKTYRFTIWMKENNFDSQLYFGMYTYNSAGTQINNYNSAGVGSSNNYFWYGDVPGGVNTWYKFTGYLLPCNTPNGWTNPPDTTNNNFRMDCATNYVALRFLNYDGAGYGSGSGTSAAFALPSVVEVQSSQPAFSKDASNYIIDVAGNVGIGTTSPTALLSVAGSLAGNPQPVVSLDTSDWFTLAHSSGYGSINWFAKGNGTNYIATHPSVIPSQITGYSGGIQIASAASNPGAGNIVNFNSLMQADIQHFGFYNTSGTNLFFINSTSGNVGIDTTSPSYPLDVNGTIRNSGEFISSQVSPYGQFRAISGNYGMFIRNDGSNTFFLLTNSSDQYGSWNTLRPFYFNDASGAVSMLNGVTIGGGLTSDQVTSAGPSTSWGVTPTSGGFRTNQGTSSSATWLAYGYSSSNFRGGIQLLDAGGTMRLYYSSTGYLQVANTLNLNGVNVPTGSGTTNYVPLWSSGTGLGNSNIYQSGSNIGIGVSPSAVLSLYNTSAGTPAALNLQSGTGNRWWETTSDVNGGTLIFNTGATQPTTGVLAIQSTGNVGITGNLTVGNAANTCIIFNSGGKICSA